MYLLYCLSGSRENYGENYYYYYFNLDLLFCHDLHTGFIRDKDGYKRLRRIHQSQFKWEILDKCLDVFLQECHFPIVQIQIQVQGAPPKNWTEDLNVVKW